MNVPRKLLVLCEGNICRSPVAASALALGLPGWDVESAGLGALVGEPAAPEMLALDPDDSKLAAHRARQVDERMVREAELVLVMTSAQREEAERRFPWARGRIFRLGHWDGFDVPDPYRRPAEMFRAARDQILQAASSWARKLA